MKKVKVKYIDHGWGNPPYICFETGFLLEDGYVLSIDEIGGTELLKYDRMEDDETVVISNDVKDYLPDNPQLLIKLLDMEVQKL